MASVLDRVREIASDKLSVDIEEIKPESSFTEDLEADSLDVVELIMAIEEEFGTDDVVNGQGPDVDTELISGRRGGGSGVCLYGFGRSV